jgi:hypothetical protein
LFVELEEIARIVSFGDASKVEVKGKKDKISPEEWRN